MLNVTIEITPSVEISTWQERSWLVHNIIYWYLFTNVCRYLHRLLSQKFMHAQLSLSKWG